MLGVLVALLLIGAGALIVQARSQQSEATTARAAASDLDGQRAQLVAQSAQEDATQLANAGASIEHNTHLRQHQAGGLTCVARMIAGRAEEVESHVTSD